MGCLMHNRPSMLRPRHAAAFAISLLLAVAHTWPLALDPGRYSRNDNADAELNAWILAWVAHQLPRDPLNLFEANIFYPAHDSLAFSEPLIVPALMGAPMAWATTPVPGRPCSSSTSSTRMSSHVSQSSRIDTDHAVVARSSSPS